jgi:hypothetical protein
MEKAERLNEVVKRSYERTDGYLKQAVELLRKLKEQGSLDDQLEPREWSERGGEEADEGD